MESPQLALLLSLRATEHYAGSAEPWAPVVAESRRDHRRRVAATAARVRGQREAARPLRTARLARTRSSLATALHRAGDAVAPSCDPRGLVR